MNTLTKMTKSFDKKRTLIFDFMKTLSENAFMIVKQNWGCIVWVPQEEKRLSERRVPI